MLRSATLASLGFALCASAAAQSKTVAGGPPLRIVDSLVIDTKGEDMYGAPVMALRANGSIAILGGGARLFLFDSLGRRRWVRSLRAEVRMINGIGWREDSIFVIDNLRDEVLFVGANGGVGSSIEFPDMIRPLWRDRAKLPAYGVIDVAAVIADGTLLGTPRRPHRFGVYGGANLPANTVPVVRVDADGIIQSLLGMVVNDPKGDQWFLMTDGRLLVARNTADSTRLIGISPRGDTTFKRMLPKAKQVIAAIPGPDGSIWLTTGTGGPNLIHTAYDSTGSVLGRIELAIGLRVGAGDARHLWVFEMRGQTRRIVRYRLR